MRAIVLVGGEGTRLRPLTWRTPKALVPVLGRPLLEHLLTHLRVHGVDAATLALTHRNEAIHEAFGDGSHLGMHIDYAYEDTPLGSGGAIGAVGRSWRAAGWMDETFLVVNGDVATDLDVSAMVAAHRNHRAVLSLSLHEVDDPSPFGVVEIDETGHIRRFVEKPPAHLAPSRLINAGTWVFEPELIDRLDPASFNRVEDGLFPTLCHEGKAVYGYSDGTYWADVGNPAALLRVNLDMATGHFASDFASDIAIGDRDGRYVNPTADVDAAASVTMSVIGADTRVSTGAQITRSLLWDAVEVGEGAVVEDSILASGVCVGAGARVTAAIVGHGAVIAPGTVIAGQQIDPAEGATPATVRTP